MANELEKAITIKDAVNAIDAGDLLLPSIQRRFVWSTRQIEFLFDSIMQDYPINTFMFWSVKDNLLKNNFRFYEFLKKYIEYQGGNNPEKPITAVYKDFKAVIDGQQRLNSLYIGLKGSYAYKKYRYRGRNYKKDEKDYPTRKLFLDLLNPLENHEEQKKYDFRFLIDNEYNREKELKEKEVENQDGKIEKVECFWFEVRKIFEFGDLNDVVLYLDSNKLKVGDYSGKTLIKLFNLIHAKPIINFYLEKEQSFDKILYEFIRTNSGGTALSFADLLMSIITASWEMGKSTKGAREEIDSLRREISDIGFNVSQDFILKTCLVLFSSDIRFSLKNFTQETIGRIKLEWGKLTLCIKASFELAKSISFNNNSLRAKNSVIPIIYYLFKSGNYNTINKENLHIENKAIIKKYLHIAQLKKLFGGSSDGFLKQIREVISKDHNDNFPFEKLIDRFKGGNRSFVITDENIDVVLRTSYGSLDSFYVLALLYPKFNFEFKNPNIDHLHPKSWFLEQDYSFLGSEEDKEFYRNHWNTVLNLSLLSEEQNKSKNKSELKKWIKEKETHNLSIRNQLLIPERLELDIINFKEFIEKRECLLREKLLESIK